MVKNTGIRYQVLVALLGALLLAPAWWRLQPAFAQQAQAQSGQPLHPMNVKYVQGVGPGYWPTAGSNLVLNLAPGTAVCSNVVESYAGGTLTLAPSATNYVYLDTTQNCAPASNTTGFTSTVIPIATVVATSTAISSVNDVRTMFISNGPLTAADLPATISSNTTGNAATATALAATPAQCGANNWASGISASGNANCAQPGFGNVSGTAAIAQGGTGQTTASSAFNALSPLTTEGDLLYYHSSANARLAAGTSGQCLTMSGSDPAWGSCSTGSGTVTSVGLSLPSMFSVSGSPVTQSGTLTASLANQNANLVMAGPVSGSGAAPTFRALVGADLPAPTAASLGGIESVSCATGLFLNQISTAGVASCAEPSSGGSGSSTGLGNGTTVIDASLESGTDFGSKVNAAIAACPTVGCTVDARGFTSPQTMSTSINLVISGSDGITLLLPKGTINRSAGAVFTLQRGDRVIGQGGQDYNTQGTFISNVAGDTSTVFNAQSTDGVFISDLVVWNNGPFTVEDLSASPHSVTYATGTCFDLTSALHAEIDRVFMACQTDLIVTGYYSHFSNDTFSFDNPSGVGVYLAGSTPNSNQFEDCKFGGAGTAIYTNSSGGWDRFHGGDIENAGAGIVVYSGTNDHFQDFYFEAVGPVTGSPYYAVWQASWPYIQGAVIGDGSGHAFICVAAGTSASSEPTFNTSAAGVTTTDGGATWAYVPSAATQVVWGPNAVGNEVDGWAYQVSNFSGWGATANIVNTPLDLASVQHEPEAIAADNINIGGGLVQNYTGAQYQYYFNQNSDSSGVKLNWSGYRKWESGWWGLAPLSIGGLLSQGGFGTTIANQLNVVGVANPAAPTVTLSSSHSGSSTVSYALTAWCGSSSTPGNGPSTMVGSFTQITDAPNTPGALISAAVSSGGTGYTNGATITITGGVVSVLGTGTATATITATSGVVTAVSITSAGYGYIDGSTAVATSGGGGSGLTLNLTAYALVEVVPATVSYGWLGSNPMSGCVYDLVKDPAGGTSTAEAVSTKQGLIASTGFAGMLLDYGPTLASYTPPTRNSTADEVHNGYVAFNNAPSDGTTVACLDSAHDLSTGCNITQLNDANGNPTVKSVATASAVDYLTVTNGAAGSPGVVTVAPAGSDTNVLLTINGKGSGGLALNAGGTGTLRVCNTSSCTTALGSGTTINSSGLFTAYNSANLAGNGIVTITGASNVTAQSASQSTVTLQSNVAAGSYLIRYYIDENAACTTVGSASAVFTFSWTDATAARTATVTLTPVTTSGASNYLSGVIPLYSAASDAITYSSTYTACTSGTWSYDMHASVERTQ